SSALVVASTSLVVLTSASLLVVRVGTPAAHHRDHHAADHDQHRQHTHRDGPAWGAAVGGPTALDRGCPVQPPVTVLGQDRPTVLGLGGEAAEPVGPVR